MPDLLIESMKAIFTFTFLSFLLVDAYSQMPAAGNRIKNPYYSRTATEKLEVSNATWKKILPADLYAVARTPFLLPSNRTVYYISKIFGLWQIIPKA
jgi:hypothetical protein